LVKLAHGSEQLFARHDSGLRILAGLDYNHELHRRVSFSSWYRFKACAPDSIIARGSHAAACLARHPPTKGLNPPKNIRLPSNGIVSGLTPVMRSSFIAMALTSSRWARDR